MRRVGRALIGVAVTALAVSGLLTTDYMVYPNVANTMSPCGNKGENGLWLRYLWYFGKKSDTRT